VSDPRVVDHLVGHLTLLAELGVDGFTRDPLWRRRAENGPDPADRASEVDQTQEAPGSASWSGGHEQRFGEATVGQGIGHGEGAGGGRIAERPLAGARSAEAPTGPSVSAAPAPPAGGAAAGGGRRVEDPGPAGGLAAAPASLFDEEPLPRDVPADPAAALVAIREDLGDCTRCKLHALGRTQIVFGVGNPRAALMFVGEAPGADEDAQGIPFVGRAGQLLTRIIEAIGLKRDDVYIANVIKCRPPGNRNPEPDEVAACEPFLMRQIDAIRPKVIVALGTFAARALVGGNVPISRLRGRVFACRGARLVPTFHPAYLLRNPEAKRDTWEDMKKVRKLLAGEAAD